MDKRDSLKSIKIRQSAAKPRIEERSETIPKGSRVEFKLYPKRGDIGYIYFISCSKTNRLKYIGQTIKEIEQEILNGYTNIRYSPIAIKR